MIAPWADVLYACDSQWWRWHHDKTKDFKGLRMTRSAPAKKLFPDLTWIYGETVNTGLSDGPDYIKCGHLGGYQAINLAVNFGAKEIILLGYDCRVVDGLRHWHGEHPGNPTHGFNQWAPSFRNLVPDLEARGVNVWNCTPGSAIDAFPIRRIEEVI